MRPFCRAGHGNRFYFYNRIKKKGLAGRILHSPFFREGCHMSTQGGVFFLPDSFPGQVCLSSLYLFYILYIIRVISAVRVVGYNRADDAADDQCADPVPAVHAAMVVMVMMMRRIRCGVTLNDGAAAMDDGTAVVDRTAVPDGTAFVHNGTAVMDRAAVADGTAFVRHGLCLVDRAAFVHNGTAVVDRTAVADGTAFVHHGLRLVARTAFVYRLHSLGRCAFMNGRSCLVTGTFLHRGFHLMAGGAFLRFPPDLL